MKKTLMLMAAGSFCLVSGSALADGYGSAGCGLGSLIFEPSNDFVQIFAATTNGTSGNQTFAITTGTSNCDGAAQTAASAKAFVETNRAAIAKDIARGRGETVASLTELAGCSEAGAVGKRLQQSFKQIFPTSRVTDGQVSDRVLEVLRSDASLSCQNLG
jgi:hypothetical protein